MTPFTLKGRIECRSTSRERGQHMFFIIWATKRRVRNLGIVGPYTCRRCGTAAAFLLRVVEKNFSLYFIPFGWRAEGHYTVCPKCTCALAVPSTDLAALQAQAAQSMLPLRQQVDVPGELGVSA
jgi:hypothetical protein